MSSVRQFEICRLGTHPVVSFAAEVNDESRGNGKAVPEISHSKLRGLLEGLNGKTWKKWRSGSNMPRLPVTVK